MLNLHKTRGFTLVELLVVVAIVALLISLLLPALTKARKLASQVACASNLKQIHLGFVYYANDHDDYIAPASGWEGSNPSPNWNGVSYPSWYDNLREYMPGLRRNNNRDERGDIAADSVLRCPSVDQLMASLHPGTGLNRTTYGMAESG